MIALPPALAPLAARWLAIALVAIALVSFGYVWGIRSEFDRHADTIAQIATVGGRQAGVTRVAADRQRDVNQSIGDHHAKAADALRARLGPGRVRQPATLADRRAVPGVPNAAGQPDGGPADIGPGTAGLAAELDAERARLAALKSDAAQTTLLMLEQRAWIAEQRRIWEAWCAAVECRK